MTALLDMTPAVAALASVPITRTRRAGAYVDATWAVSSSEDAPITGVVVPARGRDLLRLPEGQRGMEAIKVFSNDALRVAEPDSGGMADLLILEGVTYEVEHVEPWRVGGFWDAVAVRLGD